MSVASRSSFDFPSYWTPLVRNLIVVLVAIYFAELATGPLLLTLFAWQDIGNGFRPWQIVTSFFLSGPDPTSAFFTWLGLFFFTATVHRELGPRTFWQAMGVIWAASSVLTVGAQALGLVNGMQIGMGPFITAMVAFFGFRNPTADVLVYFFPVKAIWLARGTGFISLLWLAYAPSPATLLVMLFWVGAWAWTTLGNGTIRRARLEWKRRDIERKMARFQVIEGGRDSGPKKDDWVN